MEYNIVKCRIKDGTVEWKERSCYCLVQSVSCAEAEAIVTEDLTPLQIEVIKQIKIDNIVNAEDGQCFFFAKIGYITFNEKTAKETIKAVRWLIGGTDFNDAYEMLLREFKGSVSDIEILGLTKADIYKFYPNKQEQ